MLDRMLENVLGLPRSKVRILNVVKGNVVEDGSPKGGQPSTAQAESCRPCLLKQLRLVRPKLVLVLGRSACRLVFEVQDDVDRIRGQWRRLRFGGGEVKAMATFHPARLLRQPGDKRQTFADLKSVRAALEELK
jgi:DNA polymerase